MSKKINIGSKLKNHIQIYGKFPFENYIERLTLESEFT